jgi:hypothetical protein
MRGLRILRSDTDNRLMAWSGNLLTHYGYRYAQVRAALPAGSPFSSASEARKFAGPLPYTFDYERETNSIVSVRGVRENWDPQPVAVDIRRTTFFRREPFCRATPLLANAFHLSDVPYRWERGVLSRVA